MIEKTSQFSYLSSKRSDLQYIVIDSSSFIYGKRKNQYYINFNFICVVLQI